MTELPKGWEWSTVGEVAHLVNGDRGKHYPSKSDLVAEGMPFVNAGHLNAGAIDFSTMNYITPDRFHLLRGTAFVADDILYCLRGSLGKMAVVRGSQTGKVASSLVVVRPSHMISSDFMYHWLASPGGEAEIARYDNGSAQPNLAAKSLASFRLPTPPEPEQQRIVAAVDEAFSKLDAGEAGLQTVRQLVKRMRDAVLAAAASGRLVPQDPTDTPATKLLADLGVSPMADEDLPLIPGGWTWAELGSLAHDKGYGTSVKCSYDDSGPGVLRIPNIQRGSIDLSDLKRAPHGADLDDRLFLRPGDLLIVRTNGSRDLIGRCAPVTRDVDSAFASYLIRFRLDPSQINVEYASMMLSSPWWRSRLEQAAASSAGQYNLSLRSLEPMPVALPPLPEQDKIVSEVDRQLSDLVACERAMEAGVALSRGLRRSVLKAAFEGRLVPQDPSDEPASVLLERIRAERAAAPEAARRSRRTA